MQSDLTAATEIATWVLLNPQNWVTCSFPKPKKNGFLADWLTANPVSWFSILTWRCFLLLKMYQQILCSTTLIFYHMHIAEHTLQGSGLRLCIPVDTGSCWFCHVRTLPPVDWDTSRTPYLHAVYTQIFFIPRQHQSHPRPTQPPTLSRMGNNYQPVWWCSVAGG